MLNWSSFKFTELFVFLKMWVRLCSFLKLIILIYIYLLNISHLRIKGILKTRKDCWWRIKIFICFSYLTSNMLLLIEYFLKVLVCLRVKERTCCIFLVISYWCNTSFYWCSHLFRTLLCIVLKTTHRGDWSRSVSCGCTLWSDSLLLFSNILKLLLVCNVGSHSITLTIKLYILSKIWNVGMLAIARYIFSVRIVEISDFLLFFGYFLELSLDF